MPHPVDVHVGQKVREARAAKSMSQEQLGKLLGISFQQVQKYEKGTNRIGSSRLYEISVHLEVPVSFLFDGIEEAAERQAAALPRKTIELARQIDRIPNDAIRNQVLALIKSCANMEPA